MKPLVMDSCFFLIIIGVALLGSLFLSLVFIFFWYMINKGGEKEYGI
jgi:hypothetical protein